MNTKWFTSRGLKVLGYQKRAINQVHEKWEDNDVVVLAACPSAGKTLMSIYLIDEYLKENPDHKVLVLAHGTTVLRSQYYDSLEEANPGFTYNLVEKRKDYDKKCSVNVCLPQTIKNARLNRVDLLIVDEAHQFYYADMVRDIIRRTRPTRQLLLTGTPSKFIYNELEIVPVSINTIHDEGMVSDLYVEVAQSGYDFDDSNYNRDGELLTSTYIRNRETVTTLDELLKNLHYRLKRNPKDWNINKLAPKWSSVLGKLKKTMIACKSQNQARSVKRYFEDEGISCALSISDDDVDSTEIERFKNDDDCLVLIVVGRGILGFNYPWLTNVVDMTMSKNIDRIFQLLCRVVRLHPEGKGKLFVKVAPHERSDEFRYIMTATLCLSDEEYFVLYNGKNFMDMSLIIRNSSRRRADGTRRSPEEMTPRQRRRHIRPVRFDGLPVIEFFQNILHSDAGDLSFYAKTSMGIVRSMFNGRNPHGYWTKERCIDEARKYATVSEWNAANTASCQMARRNGWMDECCEHMSPRVLPKGHWTKERCIEDANNYNSRKEWLDNSSSSYTAAYKNGWLDECMPESKKPKGYWIKERCIEEAKKFRTMSEWREGSPSSRVMAQRNGWLEECKRHLGGEL